MLVQLAYQGIRACGEWTYSDLTDLLDLEGEKKILGIQKLGSRI